MKNVLIIEELYSSQCNCELCKLIDGTKKMASKNRVEMGYKELANLLIASQVGHMNMRK